AIDAGRLFDERHDCDLRPHPRESEDLPPGAARSVDQPKRKSDAEPNDPDLGFNISDGVGAVPVRWTSTKGVLLLTGSWNSDWYVLFCFRCKSNRAILAQFRGSAEEARVAIVCK